MITSKQKLREKLRLKDVGLESLDQFNELLRYVFQVTNQVLEESGYEDGEIIRAKGPILQNSDVIGWFNGEQLVSQLCIYPCNVNVHGKILKMAGLTGVGTYPEYANMGLMHDLIKVALSKMRDNQQWISYLYPYSVPFYRNKGWEVLNEHITFNLKDTQIPKYKDVPGFVERLDIDHKDVIAVYDKYSLTNHGALIRDEQAWNEYWRWENEEERIAAVYYDPNQKPMGYILYWIEKDIFHIKEMIYLNQEARRGLWNFIYAHFSMVDEVKGNIYRNEPMAFLLEDSQIEESIVPYFMARIVDVEAFLKVFPFQDVDENRPFHFIVDDPVAEWNRGTFSVSLNTQGKVEIGREPMGEPINISIQTLSAMLMNFRRPSYFYKLERITASPRAIRILDNVIPDDLPYFSDYF